MSQALRKSKSSMRRPSQSRYRILQVLGIDIAHDFLGVAHIRNSIQIEHLSPALRRFSDPVLRRPVQWSLARRLTGTSRGGENWFWQRNGPEWHRTEILLAVVPGHLWATVLGRLRRRRGNRWRRCKWLRENLSCSGAGCAFGWFRLRQLLKGRTW